MRWCNLIPQYVTATAPPLTTCQTEHIVRAELIQMINMEILTTVSTHCVETLNKNEYLKFRGVNRITELAAHQEEEKQKTQ